MNQLIPSERIDRRIYLIRGHKVILSPHLAEFYEVEPRSLMQAVKRNIERFPDDFIFQLTDEEFEILKSQFVISSWGGLRSNPYAFTEQGVAMVSAVLRSHRAVQVSIEIIRAFIRLRRLVGSHRALARKMAELEKKVGSHDKAIQSLFTTIHVMMNPDGEMKKVHGFKRNEP